MLQIKFDFRLNIFNLNFFCIRALIIHELGLGKKEIENQPWLIQN